MIQAAPTASTASSFDAASLAQLFSVLSHEIRLEILELLAQGEMDVSNIAEVLELSVSAASHHLILLRKAGFVRVERCKTRHVYSLTNRIERSVHQSQVAMVIHTAGAAPVSNSVSGVISSYLQPQDDADHTRRSNA